MKNKVKEFLNSSSNYEVIEYINKLQKELNDENLQCSKYAIEINDLKENNKKLKDNWNKLKEDLKVYIENEKYRYLSERNIDRCRKEVYEEVLDEMQELEQGSDKNV